MNDFWEQILDFCQTTTQTVGDRLMADFGKLQAQQKADGSLVTQADKWSDSEITAATEPLTSPEGFPFGLFLWDCYIKVRLYLALFIFPFCVKVFTDTGMEILDLRAKQGHI